jgi:hypothetical protein
LDEIDKDDAVFLCLSVKFHPEHGSCKGKRLGVYLGAIVTPVYLYYLSIPLDLERLSS